MESVNIEEMLNSHGVKPTPQRAVIAQFLFNTDSHPTAEEVMKAVEGKLPVSLSRATVYNTLNTLVDAGVIKEVITEPGATRYDANTSNHHHFVDTKTGRIIDIEPQELNNVDIKLGSGYRVKGYHITFYGELD